VASSADFGGGGSMTVSVVFTAQNPDIFVSSVATGMGEGSGRCVPDECAVRVRAGERARLGGGKRRGSRFEVDEAGPGS
jgi:hypothetical protein